jgi:permuted papain-like amidase YaeF/Yiix C92 family enzyme
MGLALKWAGRKLAQYLSSPGRRSVQIAIDPPLVLASALRPGDVLLVDGNTRIASAIKYLTQSTWSHAALYVGDALGSVDRQGRRNALIEADIVEGVRAVPLEEYSSMATRICRPVGLSAREIGKVIAHAVGRIGHKYDLKNVLDLARYLFPTPPVPARLRRRMIALGSGDPTRAICSTLIAQAFQSVGYPILPEIRLEKLDDPACSDCYREILHIRHHSLIAPRDFDISPYFSIVKPVLAGVFDFRSLDWARAPAHEADRLAA